MKTLTFKNGDQMPALGLGTWKSAPGEVYEAVKVAIKEGYRHIDCAPIYENEKEVGKAINECISEGIVSRKELWITSKLWNNAHAFNEVKPALKQTLNDLQLEYLDLFLIHWPVALKKGVLFPQSPDDFVPLTEIPLETTWKAMEETKRSGHAKHIGVSNFGIENLSHLLENAEIKPEMNQVESHPYLLQRELFDFCIENNVYFTAYSPLGSPDRPEGLKAENEIRLLDDDLINSIAKAHGITAGQVLIAWALQRNTSVIPKSVNPGRIKQNFEAQKVTLTHKEMVNISTLDRDFRYVSGSFWATEGSPYTVEDVWR